MKKTILIIAALCCCLQGWSWGQKGHDTTCSIAEHHLSKKAKKTIKWLLDGMSIVYWSNWLDNASHQPEFKYASTWHYKNIDADETFDNATLEPKGNIITALTEQAERLGNKSLSKEERALALKMFVHLMGDLHQPMHMGHKSDIGANRWDVTFFSSSTNLHTSWDTNLVESAHKWSFTEWTDLIDRLKKKERKQIVEGDYTSWAKETYAICKMIYEATPVGTKISYDYVAEWTPVVEQQFLRGGHRLAYMLNKVLK